MDGRKRIDECVCLNLRCLNNNVTIFSRQANHLASGINFPLAILSLASEDFRNVVHSSHRNYYRLVILLDTDCIPLLIFIASSSYLAITIDPSIYKI